MDWRTVAVGFGSGMLGAVVGVAGMGAVAPIQDMIVAKAFALVDDNDKPRAALAMSSTGVPVLSMLEPNGKIRFMIFLDKTGNPSVVMYDAAEQNRLSFALSSKDETPHLKLQNKDGSHYVRVSTETIKLQGETNSKLISAP